MIENNESNLVAAARKGEAESFSRLCEQHYSALVAIAYAQLTDRGLAEDAAQEALLVAYCDIAKLKDAGRFLPWLAAICRNTAIDMAKARIKERRAVWLQDRGVCRNGYGPGWCRYGLGVPRSPTEKGRRSARLSGRIDHRACLLVFPASHLYRNLVDVPRIGPIDAEPRWASGRSRPVSHLSHPYGS